MALRTEVIEWQANTFGIGFIGSPFYHANPPSPSFRSTPDADISAPWWIKGVSITFDYETNDSFNDVSAYRFWFVLGRVKPSPNQYSSLQGSTIYLGQTKADDGTAETLSVMRADSDVYRYAHDDLSGSLFALPSVPAFQLAIEAVNPFPSSGYQVVLQVSNLTMDVTVTPRPSYLL